MTDRFEKDWINTERIEQLQARVKELEGENEKLKKIILNLKNFSNNMVSIDDILGGK